MPPTKRRRGPPPVSGLVALRLLPVLEREVRADAAELGVELSTWFRDAARAYLDTRISSDLRAVREVVEYAARRGVTGELLAQAARLLP